MNSLFCFVFKRLTYIPQKEESFSSFPVNIGL